MSEFNLSAYDSLDQCRAEIAFLRATIAHLDEIHLGKEETFGLFLILSRAEDVLDDYLGKEEESNQSHGTEEADHA